MTNILFTLIIAMTMKITSSTLAPKYYLITYEDGKRETVVVGKNDYNCPKYCSVNHAHQVSICDNDTECDYIENSFIINKQKSANNTFNLYCKGKEIMLFEQIERQGNPDKKKRGNSIKLF